MLTGTVLQTSARRPTARRPCSTVLSLDARTIHDKKPVSTGREDGSPSLVSPLWLLCSASFCSVVHRIDQRRRIRPLSLRTLCQSFLSQEVPSSLRQ